MKRLPFVSLLAALALACGPLAVEAQEDRRGGYRPLSLLQVLRSASRHHPKIAIERARLQAASGTMLAAEGGFDLGISLTGRGNATGYYRYGTVDTSVAQPTRVLGSSLFAGYRVTRGDIPTYYGELATMEGGEVRVGVRIPLLADRAIDGRRAALARSERGVEAAGQALEATELAITRAAAQSYFGWLAAGQKLLIAEQLQALAETRNTQITRRVEEGALPAIELLENRRSILARRQAAISAARALESKAIDVSLYLRDRSGAPVAPVREQLPGAFPALSAQSISLERALAEAEQERPELRQARALVERARVDRDLADNGVQPRLDLTLQASLDVGDGSVEQRARLAEPVVSGGLTFSLPLQMRQARGRADTADARLSEYGEYERWALDQVRAEVRDAESAVRAATEVLLIAADTAEVAEAVAQGERSRLDAGATSLLIVNLREQTAAEARAKLVDAEAGLRSAEVALLTAMGRRPAD